METAIIIPPFREVGFGTVWILLEEGRWKMSTWDLLDSSRIGMMEQG